MCRARKKSFSGLEIIVGEFFYVLEVSICIVGGAPKFYQICGDLQCDHSLPLFYDSFWNL